MDLKTLEDIGLTKNEATVYLALLELGPTTVKPLIEKTNLHRSRIYDSLERLSKLGLVSFVIKSGKKHFKASNPERLLTLIKEKETKIKKILPSLKELSNLPKIKLEASIYQGKEGMKTIYEDILKSGTKEWLGMGSSGKVPEILPYYVPQLHKRRIKSRIKIRAIFANTRKAQKRAKEFLEMGLAEVKFMPKNYQSPSTTYIYNNKIAIVLYSEEILGIIIENREINKSFKNYFEWMWKISE